eukprot:8885172-Alexandrium_andersonii.AAC.1
MVAPALQGGLLPRLRVGWILGVLRRSPSGAVAASTLCAMVLGLGSLTVFTAVFAYAARHPVAVVA